MKQFFLYTLLLSTIWSCTPTDENSPAPTEVFVKYYGLGTNEAVDLAKTSTGEFIILGSNIQDGSEDFYLVKVDAEGNELDSRIYDLKGQSTDIPLKMKSLGLNSGTGLDEFLLVGYIQERDASGLDLFEGAWCKIDADLNIISTGSDSSSFNLLENVITTDIIQTTETDGVEKFVVLGHSRQTFAGDPVSDGGYQIYLTKVDDQGEVYWSKSHGYLGDEESLALFENPDRSLVVIGSTEAGADGRNVYVIETNSLGTSDKNAPRIVINNSQSGADEIPKAAIKSSLGYSIVGSTIGDDGQMAGFHVAITQTGDMVSNTNNVLSSDYSLPCQALAVTKSVYNDLMVLGSIPNFREVTGEGTAGANKLEQILLMRVSPLSGHIAGFDQNYGTTVGNDRAKAAITLPDGDILVAATIDFGSGTSMLGLLRLNRNGELKD
ncbi:hypothetical protein [Marinoscillum sp.]|uniref:hypothetical protein n=1 Tax=Marinoscillum sp. TaxID=2024838 RepID=UPI003BAD8403